MKKSILTPMLVALLAAGTLISCSDEDSDTLAPVAEETEASVKESNTQYTFYYQGRVVSKDNDDLLNSTNWVVNGEEVHMYSTTEEADAYLAQQNQSAINASSYWRNVSCYLGQNGTGRRITLIPPANIPGEGDFNNNIRSYGVFSSSADNSLRINFYDYYDQRGYTENRPAAVGTIYNFRGDNNPTIWSSLSF